MAAAPSKASASLKRPSAAGCAFELCSLRNPRRTWQNACCPRSAPTSTLYCFPTSFSTASFPAKHPQGVAALIRLKEFSFADVLERLQVGPVIVLAGLQDPGNLGTILRSAEAFGSAGVVLGEGTVSPFNSKVIRASAGSIFRLPVILAKAAGGLEEISAKLRAQSVRLIATSSHKGTPLDQANLRGPSQFSSGARAQDYPVRCWRKPMNWSQSRTCRRWNPECRRRGEHRALRSSAPTARAVPVGRSHATAALATAGVTPAHFSYASPPPSTTRARDPTRHRTHQKQDCIGNIVGRADAAQRTIGGFPQESLHRPRQAVRIRCAAWEFQRLPGKRCSHEYYFCRGRWPSPASGSPSHLWRHSRMRRADRL